jgi:hypothetical protein
MSARFDLNHDPWIVLGKREQIFLNETPDDGENGKMKFKFFVCLEINENTHPTPWLSPDSLQNFNVSRCNWQAYRPTPFFKGARGQNS